MDNTMINRIKWLSFYVGLGIVSAAQPSHADKIKNPIAVFAGLDKITGRIVAFDVSVGETVQFGALRLTPRVCYTRPATEEPNTTTFLEVEEITLDGKKQRIFTGWMFASSPGLHGVEHPIYDVWLTNCKGGTEIVKSAPKLTIEGEGKQADAQDVYNSQPQQEDSAASPPGRNPRSVEDDPDNDDAYFDEE